MRTFPPSRIVCLTEETVETLYLIGEDHRIVGVSGYAVRPPRVRREKIRVSSFISANIERILALEPDLILTFSDIQADISRELIKEGATVHAFNHRDVAGILSMIKMLGAIVGAMDRAEQLSKHLSLRMHQIQQEGKKFRWRPRVYFEEWDEPMICGSHWVSELIGIAGGLDIFADRARSAKAAGRVIRTDDVISVEHDIIIGSWCGKKFKPESVAGRSGFSTIPAVQNKALFEVKSSIMLQPGPAALTDGIDALVSIMRQVQIDAPDPGDHS